MCPSNASPTCVAPHSSSCTRLLSAWSAVASPVGRYGAASNAARSRSLAALIAAGVVVWPSAAARSRPASSPASSAAAARSRFPGAGGESSSTAMVPATDAIHQPASRSGIVAAPPAETTGST